MFKNVIFGAVVVLCLLSQTAFGIRNIHANRRAAPQVVDPDEKTSGDDAILVLKKKSQNVEKVMKIGILNAIYDKKLKEKIPAILPTIQSHGFTMDSLEEADLSQFDPNTDRSITALLDVQACNLKVYATEETPLDSLKETRELGRGLVFDLSILGRSNPPNISGKGRMDYTIKMTKKKDNRAKYYYLT
eukprot:Platyproteum_vivax@DN2507_c0_g1_i1.p1